MSGKIHCAFSLQRPSPATAKRHQAQIQFSLRSENSENAHKKYRLNYFVLGEAGRRYADFGLAFCSRVRCLGWLPNFFVMSPPVSFVFRMQSGYFHFVLLCCGPCSFLSFPIFVFFLIASFGFRLFCRRPNVFLVCRRR